MESSTNKTQLGFGFEAPTDVHEAASENGVEAAWIESERGKPATGKGAPRTVEIEALFGRRFKAGVPTEDEWRATLHADDAQRATTALAAGRKSGVFDTTYRIVRPDGTTRRVRDRIMLLADRWQLRIISLLNQASSNAIDVAAPDVGRWLDVALDEAILRCDHLGRVTETFGPPALLPEESGVLLGRRVSEVETLPSAMRHGWSTAFERSLDTQRGQITAYTLDRGDGLRSFEARMLPLGGGATVIAIRDVGERNLLRERVEYIAMHDGVTGLGNMRVLRERLGAWMRLNSEGTSIDATPVALLIIDLDRFKQSNDLQGRSIGDSLLRLVAQRLHREAQSELRGRAYDAHDAANPNRHEGPIGDVQQSAQLAVVRLGGDQFAIAWRIGDAGDEARARAIALADRVITALAAPTRIAGQTLFVRASIGLALYPADALDPSTLFSQAEAALKRAKLAGRNQHRRHGDDDALTRSASLPPNSEAALRAALASNQFLLVYQPKFELASSLTTGDVGERGALNPGAMIAVEALVRWRTPSGALLIPQDFISLAEASGMIRPLGDWVLRTALAEVGRFASQGAKRVGVTINISLLQLHDRAFVETVSAALREHGFAAKELTFEIAETAFLEDIRLVADSLAELAALGVRLAIDHFGVGTAGLVALKSLPVDEIKIDRTFIAGAAIDAFDATIVAGLIEMAHNLGMTVTADGVERVDQIAALSQMRCDAIQGYFVGEPMAALDLVAQASLWQKTRA
jgi:predicted signal transduction protein with EAL and GGDEF domain